MNEKTVKKIRKYAKMRATKDARYTPEAFLKVYKRASKRERDIFLAEVDNYIEAVNQEYIEAGDPLPSVEIL